MKFFDRFFGRNEPENEKPENTPIPPEKDLKMEPVSEASDYQEQEHIAKALSVLLSLHQDKKSDETLMNVLRCLMENPPVWVSMDNGKPQTTVSDAGEKLLPIFTSMDQIAASYQEGKNWTQIRFLDLKPHITRKAALTGILINGFSHEFLLHRMTFPMFFDMTKEPASPPIPSGKTIQLSPVGKEADALKEAAIKFLATHNCRQAYLGKLNSNGEESYLFAIEQNDCPDSEFFKQMDKELSAIPTNLPIDYTSYEGFRKHITPNNCQMIFHQGQ